MCHVLEACLAQPFEEQTPECIGGTHSSNCLWDGVSRSREMIKWQCSASFIAQHKKDREKGLPNPWSLVNTNSSECGEQRGKHRLLFFQGEV